jgi:hypothetical protein
MPRRLVNRNRRAVPGDDDGTCCGAEGVDPGVVRALLHHDVARLQMHLGVVKEHVDLAVQHDGIVDRTGAVGVHVALVALRRRIDPHLLENLVVVDAVRQLALDRREIDHAADRAVAGRRHAGLLVHLVARMRQIDRRFVGHPDVGHHVAFAALIDVGRRAIHQDHGLAVGVVARDDASDWLLLHFTPRSEHWWAASFGSAKRLSMLARGRPGRGVLPLFYAAGDG